VDCCDVIPEDIWFTVVNNSFELFDYDDFADVVVIDFETVYCPTIGKRLPIMAVALSDNKLYYYRPTYELMPQQLEACPSTIPFPSGRVVIGHFVSYDRKYLDSEYSIDLEPNYFVDTAALATLCHGISNQQELIFLKCLKDKNDGKSNAFSEWFTHATRLALGSKIGLYHYLFNTELNKDVRDEIVKERWDMWANQWVRYAEYCQKDVLATNRVFCKLYPKARKIMPNVTSWAGMLQISNWHMVLDKNWFRYFE
jgi:DNA polymerase gamma 1